MNARFLEVLDFAGGFFLIDLFRDDGTDTSLWPWQGPDAKNQCSRPELPY